MADTDPNGSGLELDIKPKPSSPSGVRSSGSVPGSSPSGVRSGTTGVRSAYRTQPLPTLAPEKKKLSKAALQEGAIDTLLNSVSVLGELAEDFRNSDRFFKYKAMVLGTWLFLSLSTFAVACPSQGPANEIEAHLIVSGAADAPIYMVKNNSLDPWNDVEVIVNGLYRSTTVELAPNDSIGLSPAVLYDGEGKHPPQSLRVTDIEVRVLDPEAKVKLLVGGQPQ